MGERQVDTHATKVLIFLSLQKFSLCMWSVSGRKGKKQLASSNKGRPS